MRFIRKWSYALAMDLSRNLNDSHAKRHIYYYGLQVVIGVVIDMIMLILSALVFGVIKELFLVLAFFGLLRVVAGGFHMDNYLKCMITSTALFTLSALIVKHTFSFWSAQALLVFMAAAFLTGVYVIIKWAPADTPNLPIVSPKKKRKLKILSLVDITIWLVICSLLIYHDLKLYALAACIGITHAIFIVSPLGYRFYNWVSGRYKFKKN